jgi:hypothetical protein
MPPAASRWRLGWWSVTTPGLDPAQVIDPALHGPLLTAAAAGMPLDPLGRSRLEGLRSLGLTGVDFRPRFPVVPAEPAAQVRAAAERLGAAVAKFLAGEWSRFAAVYEPLTGIVPGRGSSVSGEGAERPWGGWPGGSGYPLVGGLLLDIAVRRLLRREGLTSPPFGGAFAWLAEGEEGIAGTWFARTTGLPGRGYLIRFGDPASPAFDAAAADPEAAPALPAAREPDLLRLVDALAAPVARLVVEAIPELEKARPTPPGEDPGAALAWAYTLATDAALSALAGRGLVTIPADGVVAFRVAGEALASS